MNQDLKKKIDKVFEKYKRKFFKLPRKTRLTQYEKCVGFTEETRVGSKQFANQLGYFMEDIYNLSSKFTKINLDKAVSKGSNDGESLTEFFECKSRHDTMKQSMAAVEIKCRLLKSIEEGKNFKLLISSDIDEKNRDIPLHEGFGLKTISKIPKYDPSIHRWLSGDKIYQYLFEGEWKNVKEYILSLLATIKV